MSTNGMVFNSRMRCYGTSMFAVGIRKTGRITQSEHCASGGLA
jgi:hypothetical protein